MNDSMENHNAKHFALQLGALISLYVVLGALISLLFGVITLKFPDELDSYWVIEGANGSIRFGIALLVVFFPAYVALTRHINVARRAGAAYLSITKWSIYLSLVVGGAVLLGDLVMVINNFLNGELTTRFLLKAATVLIVVGVAFNYYLRDAKEYWQGHEKQSKQYGYGAALLVLVALVGGYLTMESPHVVRERKADQTVIDDLGRVQVMVLDHYVVQKSLPESLTTLPNQELIPAAPEDRGAYRYKKVSDTTFELCGEFAYATREGEYSYAPYGYPTKGFALRNPDDWNHSSGEVCFTRVINEIEDAAPIR